MIGGFENEWSSNGGGDNIKKEKPYVIEKVPSKHINGNLWYCHMRGYPDIPVFGSIGDREKARKVCKMMNANAGR